MASLPITRSFSREPMNKRNNRNSDGKNGYFKLKFHPMKILFVLLAFLSASSAFSQMYETESPLIIGERIEIGSLILDESRILNIYLPPDYYQDSDTASYPVIYLLDGSEDEDFLHVAGLLQYCNFPWVNLEPRAILVGIANVDRRRDYTFPSTVEKNRLENPTSGKSADFMAFLESELIPFIDGKYRTKNERTIIGQSLGGLLASEVLLTRPQLFNRYVIISPSMWWDNGSLLDRPQDFKDTKDRSVYIAVGKEGKAMVNGAKKLNSKLKKAGIEDVHYEYFPGDSHATMGHLQFYRAFQLLE